MCPSKVIVTQRNNGLLLFRTAQPDITTTHKNKLFNARASAWLIRTTIQFRSDAIVAQHCFTYDVLAFHAQKEGAPIQDCLEDCRHTISRSRFNFYPRLFTIHVPTIISVL